MASDGTEQLDFPKNWDELSERQKPRHSEAPGKDESRDGDGQPLTVSLFAATWAEIVAIAAVCTLALLGLVVLGYQATLPAFPWAAAVGLLWWTGAATATVMIRRGTPGMLLAGVVLDGAVRHSRIPAILMVSLLLCTTLGLPTLLGPRRSLLRLVSGQELTAVEGTP